MNICTFVGRIGRDGELRTTPNGHEVLGFSVASDVGFGDKKHTLWIKCSIWGKRAKAIEPYIKKGGAVTVSGDIDLKIWESEGRSGTDLELNCRDVALHSVPQQEASNDTPAPAADAKSVDDIPF